MVMIGKGLSAIKEAAKNSVSQLKLKDGESALIRIAVPTDELISVYEHVEQFGGKWHTITCLGKNDCPICQAGKFARFVTYIPVLHRNENDAVKIFKASKRTGMAILGLVEEYGDITKRDFKITRQGKDTNTVYQFFPKDPVEIDLSDIQIPDIEVMVHPMTREAILALMQGNGEVTDAPPVTNNPITKNGDFPF